MFTEVQTPLAHILMSGNWQAAGGQEPIDDRNDNSKDLGRESPLHPHPERRMGLGRR